jgi:hypothetical protein
MAPSCRNGGSQGGRWGRQKLIPKLQCHLLVARSPPTYYDNTTGGNIGRQYSGAFSLNTWYHVAATYDGGTSASGVKIYINGVRVDDTDNVSGSFAAVRDISIPFTIGQSFTSNVPNYFSTAPSTTCVCTIGRFRRRRCISSTRRASNSRSPSPPTTTLPHSPQAPPPQRQVPNNPRLHGCPVATQEASLAPFFNIDLERSDTFPVGKAAEGIW